MKIKLILVLCILISGIVFVQSSSVSGSSVIYKTNSDKFENYSTDIQNALNKEPFEWTKKYACLFMKGCFEGKMCYPLGYAKEGKYCSDELEDYRGNIDYGFVDQKGWGNLCENNFECESNICYEGKCVRTIESELIDSLTKRINELEERINSLEEELNFESDSLITGEIVSENTESKKGFFSRLFGK